MRILSKKPLFIRIAQPTYGAYLLKRNHVELVGMQQLSELQPPFLVIGNHVHTLDSFLISSASPVHIRWVAGAYLFKLFTLRPMLERWIGAISKQQGRNDFFTIRAIGDALKSGDIVGLFPEGTRTWDGEPVGFDQAIAKLVRMFKVPIVVMHLEGFYGLKPRWADKKRKGNVFLRVLPPIMPDHIREMSVTELYERLLADIGYSYRDWQEKNHLPYVSKRASEGVEQVLYLCPECKQASTIVSKGITITCTHCNYFASLDPYDKLHTTQGTHHFDDIAFWHAWEREYITLPQSSSLTFPPDRGVLLQTGDAKKLVTLEKRFTLQMDQEGIRIKSETGRDMFLAFESIQSMIINAKNTVELYHDNTLYRIRIFKRGCILKYVEMYQAKRTSTEGDQA